MEVLEICSGKTNYKNICFDFVFDNQSLRLIPPEDKKQEVEKWGMKRLASGTYTIGEPITMDNPYLTGILNETGQTIIFMMKQGDIIGFRNSVLFVEVKAFILFSTKCKLMGRIAFSGPEINGIHPVGQAFSITSDRKMKNDGIISIQTTDYDKTITQKSLFYVDEKKVSIHFSIGRKIRLSIQDTPLQLTSIMAFEFEPTNDYEFIYKLYIIAKQFIQYLCYRKNIIIDCIELSELIEDEKYNICGQMKIVGSSIQCEVKPIKEKRYIKQKYIEGFEGKLLSDIATGRIYLRHLPETNESGRNIDAARFIMIMAAFEWEFRRIFPEGIKKKKATLIAEDNAIRQLQVLVDSSSGKLREIYKYLKKQIVSSSLSNKIIFVGKKLGDTIDLFGTQLYHLNDEELNYSAMGERLSRQRNNYAHGNLDKEFEGLALLDLVYLELVLYAMQLKYYGVEDIKIKKSINELFHKSFSI